MTVDSHRGFERVFREGRLTFGFNVPIEAYPNSPAPTMSDHGAMARQADDAGFSVIWLRDVPFYDPAFGDVGQVFDPIPYAGWLAARTRQIAIGTAGVVAPLHDPILLAKQAATLDHLSNNRFLLGLSTGDREAEFPAFGIDFNEREARFRDAHALMREVTEVAFPVHRSAYHGRLDGRLDLIPKPVTPRMPMIAIGRCRQTIEWLAENMDGWLWHQSDFMRLPEIIAVWRSALHGTFKPYGYGVFFNLERDPDAPLRVGRGISTGRNALIELWKRQQGEGVSHVALNLKLSARLAGEVLEELGEHVLPHFS